jgi:glycosyltransferase involved in cell wall biosynthesis
MTTAEIFPAFKRAPLRVLLVHNRYVLPGGEDRVFESEAQLLRQCGEDVSTLEEQTVSPEGFLQSIGIATNSLWSTKWHRKFRVRLQEFRPDVVHIHNFFPVISPSVYYACRKAGVPVVQTLHNYRLSCPGAIFYRDGKICEECIEQGPLHSIRHACYRGSKLGTASVALMLETHKRAGTWNSMVDCYIALTEFARRKMVEGGLPAEKVRVKPNFVLPDPGRRTGSGQFALFVGRIEVQKGLPTLLEAWKRLPQSIPLVIAGDGPYAPTLKVRIAELGLSNVEWRGPQPRSEVVAAMKQARFLVFPSEWYEGFPMTIAEAFACGLPVITSRLGSMEEIVQNGRTGLHFTAGDAGDLARKVEWAWSHSQELESMGLAARVESEEKYSAQRNFEMLEEIYQSVITRRKGTRDESPRKEVATVLP